MTVRWHGVGPAVVLILGLTLAGGCWQEADKERVETMLLSGDVKKAAETCTVRELAIHRRDWILWNTLVLVAAVGSGLASLLTLAGGARLKTAGGILSGLAAALLLVEKQMEFGKNAAFHDQLAHDCAEVYRKAVCSADKYGRLCDEYSEVLRRSESQYWKDVRPFPVGTPGSHTETTLPRPDEDKK